MTILDRLLSALGLGGGHATDRDAAEPTDTVEYEPDASDEAAVKGVDAGATEASDETPEAAAGGETPDAGAAANAPDAEGTEATGSADDGPGSESVETVKGIGPAYAGRLEAAGVESVADLADADADDLAERTSLSATRVGRWIERARERRDA